MVTIITRTSRLCFSTREEVCAWVSGAKHVPAIAAVMIATMKLRDNFQLRPEARIRKRRLTFLIVFYPAVDLSAPQQNDSRIDFPSASSN